MSLGTFGMIVSYDVRVLRASETYLVVMMSTVSRDGWLTGRC